jgi:LuxR family maltose regulon positive regulatory protein
MERGSRDPLLITTKLAIPQSYLTRIISRTNIYAQLDQGLQKPLMIVTAPAGFGKTTTLSEWLRQSALKAAWVSLNGIDNDLTCFWRYIIAALNQLYPLLSEEVERWQQATESHNTEAMLTVLINALMAMPEQMILVLDNYHTIIDDAIHQSLTFLLEHLPAQVHIILVTRVDPPLPLARLRVQGKLTELHTTSLRFTAQETCAFLKHSMGLTLSEADTNELYNRTEGWVAGLQLAALSLQNYNDSATITHFIRTFNGNNRYILTYLIEEVLAHTTEEIQNFLLMTSILDCLYPTLCDAVTEQSESLLLLERLEQANLFLTAVDYQWYRYDHLFADALRHRLKQTHPQLISALHTRASTWYEQHGLLEDAMRHALEAEARGSHILRQAQCALKSRTEEKEAPLWPVSQKTEDTLIEKLSEREFTVLCLIAQCLSNQEIAQRLVVTVSTIKTHLNNIYAKLHVHTRLQAVTRAYDLGLLHRNEPETEPLAHTRYVERF